MTRLLRWKWTAATLALILAACITIVLINWLLSSDEQKSQVPEPIVPGRSDALADNFVGSSTATPIADYAVPVWILALGLVIAVGAILVAVRLLYWRRALEGGQTSIVPDLLLANLRSQERALQQTIQLQSHLLAEAKTYRKKVEFDLGELKEGFSVFAQSLNLKDAEIDRLRKGGESLVFQRFLGRFLKLRSSFQDEIRDLERSNINAKELKELLELLEDALFECGVEKFSPALGESFRDAFGVSENPDFVPTDDPERHLQIAEVLEPGFMIRTPSNKICLQPASISVFQLADGGSVQ